ncbi:GNAT family N-acetyltransferase [Streptomyces albidoflavus]
MRVEMPIRTERLVLRPLRMEDADALHAYHRREDVARYLYRPPLDREGCAKLIARSIDSPEWGTTGADLGLAVCLRGQVIGETGLRLRSALAAQAEIGWVFAPEYAGHGYATEAARAVLAAAFGPLKVHRVYARLDADNKPSWRVCERLGMRREAYLVDSDVNPATGTWGSEYVYAMLAREFAG